MDKQNIKTLLAAFLPVIATVLFLIVCFVVFLSISSSQTLYAQGGADFAGSGAAGSGPDPGSQNADGSGVGGTGPADTCGNAPDVVGQGNGPGGNIGGCVQSCGGGGYNSDPTCVWVCPTSSVTLNPPVITFTASNYNPVYSGSTVLSWSTTGSPASCTASGDWLGSKNVLGGTEAMNSIVTTRTYVLSCSNNDGTDVETVIVTPQPPPPPTLSMSASPTTVDSGGTSVITWTASNSNICTASNGWSGNPSAAGGSSPVNPIANTAYTLTCSGPGGSITRSADVSVPSGGIQASSCTIPPSGTSCPSTITWNYSNFLGPALVTQGTTPINDPSGVLRPITPTDSIFTLRDTGGNFSRQVDANAICTGTEVWTGTFCAPIPVITITPRPELVRSGSTANVDITVNSNFNLTCTLVGGVNTSFLHTASPSPRPPYTRTTTPLNSARIISITCTADSYSVITNTVETRVRVVPIIQEI